MYNNLTFNFTESSAYIENNEFYTECFEKIGIMELVYKTFSMKPTVEAKFMYVYDLLKTYKKLPMENTMINVKNDTEASNIRNQSNMYFKMGNYIEAVQGYNNCVKVAVVGSKEYAFALANRSAALFNLQKYENSIVDIHLALANNYPSELAYKLYKREVECLVNMGKMAEAKLKFKEFSSHLDHALLDKEKKIKIDNELKLYLLSSRYEKKHTDDKFLIALKGGSNKNIPALSKFVNLQYSETMGRFLYVSTDIYPGDVLAIEKPYAGVLDFATFLTNCHNCFKHCLNGIPCLKCSLVIYCDETCRIKSYENGHKHECDVLYSFLEFPSITNMQYLSFYIALTTIEKLGIKKYIEIVNALNTNSDPVMRGFNVNGKYLSDTFNSVYALEGNEPKRTDHYLFIKHCYAAVIVSYLALAGIEIPDNQLGKFGESILHILCVVTSNAHMVLQPLECSTWVPTVGTNMPRAHLLLPVLSLINHNCDPNVVRQEFNGTVVIRAIQPIKKGSQIYDSYGLLFATNSRDLRQSKLLEQYCFHCKCLACVEHWPLFWQLSNSDDIFTSSAYLKKESKHLTKIYSKLTNDQAYDGMKDLEFLYSYLKFLHDNVKKRCLQYCTVQETIKEIYNRTTSKCVFDDTNQ